MSFISLFCRRALPPHSLGSWGHVPLGVQGEREVGADGERKGDGLVLTCQPMAEVHVLGSQRGIHLYTIYIPYTIVAIFLKFPKVYERTCCGF